MRVFDITHPGIAEAMLATYFPARSFIVAGEDKLPSVPSTQPTRSFWNSTDRGCSCNTDVFCPNFYLPQVEECIPCRGKNRESGTRNCARPPWVLLHMARIPS